MTVQAVVRAFDILKFVAARPQGIGITTLAAQTGLPKSTVSRLVATLERVEAVAPVPNAATYHLNPSFSTLFTPLSFPDSLINVARPYLQSLNHAVGEDVGLAIPDGQSVLYIDQVSSDTAVQVKDWTGERFPLHWVSSGKVILAHQSAAFVEDYLARPLSASTLKTLTTVAQLRKAIANIQAEGVAWSLGEFDLAINAVSAPIFNQAGEVIAALNIYGPAYRFPAGQETVVTRQLLATSQELSKELKRIPL